MKAALALALTASLAAGCGTLDPEPHPAGAAMSKALKITESNFKAEVLDSDVPVLLDFTVEWCPPCRMIGPSVDALAADYAGRAKVGKVDADVETGLSARFGVQSLPTLIVLHRGQVVAGRVGAGSKADLAKLLDEALAVMPASVAP